MIEPTWTSTLDPPKVFQQWIPATPLLKVKLERGQKGTFAWEITFEGRDSAEVLAQIRDVNNQLERKYAQPEEKKEKG